MAFKQIMRRVIKGGGKPDDSTQPAFLSLRDTVVTGPPRMHPAMTTDWGPGGVLINELRLALGYFGHFASEAVVDVSPESCNIATLFLSMRAL